MPEGLWDIGLAAALTCYKQLAQRTTQNTVLGRNRETKPAGAKRVNIVQVGHNKSAPCHLLAMRSKLTRFVRMLSVAAFAFALLLPGWAAAAAGTSESNDVHVMVPPGDAYDMLEHLQGHNWTPPPGIKGGAVYQNSDGRLPVCGGGVWREYDIYPPGPTGRGPERILHCDGGDLVIANWYTPDHYATFEYFVWGSNKP